MAERRMFSKKITDSDEFVSLTSSAQALYLHLNQSADDDGFSNQVQMSLWKAHASPDDLKLLLAKRFIISFESGVIVVRHWKTNNYIQKDRYVETTFLEEKAQLSCDQKGVYTVCIQDGYSSYPQDSIDKVSIDKDSINNIYSASPSEKHGAEYREIVDYLNEKAGTNYKATSKATQRLINARLKEGFTVEQFKEVIDKKVADWGKDEKMSQYLRPETLFGTKFESYLNKPQQKPTVYNELDINLDEYF